MRTLAIALLAVLALPLTLEAPPASASCSKFVQPLGVWFEQADAVFVGHALEVFEVPVPPPPGYSGETVFAEYTTRFHVDECFKGELGEQVTVLADRTNRDCIVEFDVGERYIVFAFRHAANGGIRRGDRGPSDEALRSNDSSPTGRVAARADALAYVRRRAVTGREPSLVGTVYDRTPSSIQGSFARTHLGWYGVTTRSGIIVSLTGGGRTLTTPSDADGAFVFDDIPAGTYSIRLELPEGHRLLEQYVGAPFGMRPDEDAPDRVEIKEGETAARYFTVTGAASGSGRVAAVSGRPHFYAHLVLASALNSFDSGTPADNLRAFVGDRGEFEFEVIPPGEYVLVVNPGREDAFDSRGPTFYHPGVLDPVKATRFRISEGRKLEFGEIKAPLVTTYRYLDITAVNDEGVGVQVDIRCVAVELAGKEMFFFTDKTGRVRLFLRPKVRFRIGVVSPSDAQRVEGEVEVGPEGQLSPLKFVTADPPTDEGTP